MDFPELKVTKYHIFKKKPIRNVLAEVHAEWGIFSMVFVHKIHSKEKREYFELPAVLLKVKPPQKGVFYRRLMYINDKEMSDHLQNSLKIGVRTFCQQQKIDLDGLIRQIISDIDNPPPPRKPYAPQKTYTKTITPTRVLHKGSSRPPFGYRARGDGSRSY